MFGSALTVRASYLSIFHPRFFYSTSFSQFFMETFKYFKSRVLSYLIQPYQLEGGEGYGGLAPREVKIKIFKSDAVIIVSRAFPWNVKKIINSRLRPWKIPVYALEKFQFTPLKNSSLRPWKFDELNKLQKCIFIFSLYTIVL